MDEYIGAICPVCEVPFTEADMSDIVACPTCGRPYHRACYQEVGDCVDQKLHMTGESWLQHRRKELHPKAESVQQEEILARLKDGESPVDLMMEVDGLGIPEMSQMLDNLRMETGDPTIGQDEADCLDGVTFKEITAFVGIKILYYMPQFRVFSKLKRYGSINSVCLLFPHLYFANRKMWGFSLLTILVNLLLSIPSIILNMERVLGRTLTWVNTDTTGFGIASKVCALLSFVVAILLCRYGNYLYYRFAVKRVHALRKEHGAKPEYYNILSESGGTSIANILVAALISFCSYGLTVMLLNGI